MQKEILKTLDQIEAQNNVKILYACESGSRAWGFPSPDSDYDVRYLYIRPVESYLKLFSERDVIEGPIDEVKDFVGWDLQKALKLLMKGNAPLIEWVRSPIVYKDNPWLRENLVKLSTSTPTLMHFIGDTSDWPRITSKPISQAKA